MLPLKIILIPILCKSNKGELCKSTFLETRLQPHTGTLIWSRRKFSVLVKDTQEDGNAPPPEP